MKKIILIIISVSLLLIFCSISLSIYMWKEIYLPKEPGSTHQVAFSVKKGEGAKEISINLEKQGIIRHSGIFRVYVLIFSFSQKLQAGDYLLSPSMSIPEIVEKFVAGQVKKERITIIEGWNLRDIADYLESQGVANKKDFFELAGYPAEFYSSESSLPQPKDFSGEFEFLKEKSKRVSLEGYIFPDTYEIIAGTPLEDVIRKTLSNFSQKLTPELRQEIVAQNKSIFTIITMASLIEKEVRTLDDKKIVSGLLWKRLKVGMPLQVDATISYITGKKTTKISREETQIVSLYNTYKYQGLPLGPICNPGSDSILAAIYPEDSDYWYYLSTPEGETIFSKTLQEHNIAKAKYLR